MGQAKWKTETETVLKSLASTKRYCSTCRWTLADQRLYKEVEE